MGLVIALAGLMLCAQATEQRVLIVPLQPRGGVTVDEADVLTGLVASYSAKVPGYHVTSLADVEGAMSQEQLRQVAGCDSASCAAEIAGALNVDQLVLGTLGKLNGSYVLSLSRVRARDSHNAARISRVFTSLTPEVLTQELPLAVHELFSLTTTGKSSEVTRSTAPAPESPARPLPMLAGLGAAAAGALLFAITIVGSVVTAALVYGTVAPHGVSLPGPALPGSAPLRLGVVGTSALGVVVLGGLSLALGVAGVVTAVVARATGM